MNIISKLTLRHLNENKKRTIVTILGIATSTALITAILVGIFSFFKFFGYISVQTDGNVHAAFENLDSEKIAALKNDERIEYAGVARGNEEGCGVLMDTDAPMRKRVGNILQGDKENWDQMVVTDYEGRLPETASEIAVEEAFLKDNELNLTVGDSLTVAIGNRYSVDGNGEKILWGGNYRSQELFEKFSDETFVITAILHGNRPTESYDILRGADDISFDKNIVRITLKKCDHTALKQIHQIAADYDLKGYSVNSEYMMSVFAFEGSGGAMKALFTMMGIALAIVMGTSIILIYNAFGMSLAERMRYLGMLASVGATAVQKRRSVYFEGLILGLIGIPLGIFFGLCGTGLTLHILGTRILESSMIVGAEGMRGSVPMVVSPLVILSIVVLAAFTIFVSALIPVWKASKVMPVDALRQVDTIKVKGRKLRINPIVKRIFGYEGELAYKNIKRNGIKSTVITVTIAVSVIMFLTINYFCEAFSRSNYYDFNFPYQIIVTCSYDERDNMKKELLQMNEVNEVVAADFIAYVFKPTETMPIPANGEILNPDYLTPSYKTLFDNIVAIQVVTIEDEKFDKLLKNNGLSKDKYYGDELRGVLLNNYFHEDRGKKPFNEGIIGQRLFYDDAKGNPPAVEIGDLISYDKENDIFNIMSKGSISVFVPYSMFYEKASLNIDSKDLTITYLIKTDQHEALYNELNELLDAEGYHNSYCSDMAVAANAMSTVNLLLMTTMYGFTILLTLIAMANIVNTISTGVLLRRKEFAMYRSVGMTDKGFMKMIFLEILLYGIRALLIGISLSVILSYMMYRVLGSKLYSFDINYLMYLIVAVAVFAVVGLSMLFSVNKIKDDNIIEALKQDAI